MQRLLQLRVFGYLFLLGCFAIPAAAQPADVDTLWYEGWEDDWTNDWFVDAGTWEVGEPTSGPDSAYMGEQAAATVLGGNYGGSVDSRLIRFSSFVVPAASENPRLRFWHWYSFARGDNGEVQVSSDGGSTWETISPTYTATGSGVWTYPLLDLSSYAGSAVQLAFNFHSDGSSFSSGWYVDEIVVITGPLVFNNPEGFEAGLGKWHADLGTWEVGEPTSGPGSAHTGEQAAATVLGGNYGGSVDSRLISPPFVIPSAPENPSLRFWHWYSFARGDSGEVQIRIEGGDWQTIAGPFTGSSSGAWTFFNVFLSDYLDSTVQLAFELHSDGSSFSTGWYIDDLTIFCGDSPCSDIVIPVELAAFDAAMDGADVLLRWSTASETNNAGFAVERRAEREGGFEQIGFVEGAGTTSEAQTYRFTDSALLFEAERLTYRLKQIDLDGAFEYSPEVDVLVGVPKAFALHGNIPNPFGERTRLRYELPQSGDVRLTVYNVLGQRVATLVEEHQEAGRKEVVFDARGLASGVYVLRLEALGRMQTQKVTVVR